MTISRKDVDYVARLARLELTEGEKELFAGQLGHILEHMGQLAKLDTASVPPTSSVLGFKNVFRDDKAKRFENTEALLANAPAREAGYFKVPKVIE